MQPLRRLPISGESQRLHVIFAVMVMYVTFSSSAPVCACSSSSSSRAHTLRDGRFYIGNLRNGNLLIIRDIPDRLLHKSFHFGPADD
ncbi:hypothetical protein KCP75_05660 [Salmonella enterica subsp. enterica]|nr:hypothetical protein KCP75_05660 [Salmonella enterica subsp. enterica]